METKFAMSAPNDVLIDDKYDCDLDAVIVLLKPLVNFPGIFRNVRVGNNFKFEPTRELLICHAVWNPQPFGWKLKKSPAIVAALEELERNSYAYAGRGKLKNEISKLFREHESGPVNDPDMSKLLNFERCLPFIAEWCMFSYSHHRAAWGFSKRLGPVPVSSFPPTPVISTGRGGKPKKVILTVAQQRQLKLESMNDAERKVFLQNEKSQKLLAALRRQGKVPDGVRESLLAWED